MPEALDRLLVSGPSAWARLGRGPQLLLLALAALAPLVFFGAQWLTETQYVPLYSALPAEESGAVLNQLKVAKTPYRIGPGEQILVPAEKVSETRLKLAMQGLPVGGGVGFEVFDRPSLGVSDFAQRLNYQRALQGELARTIGHLREVQRARVHLVLPQPSLFAERDRPATASVFLKLTPGAALGREQIRGVVHLVASSVEGLVPERVTVVDTGGRVLSLGADPGGALSPRRLEVKGAVEDSLERRVQSLLDATLGSHQAVVRVAATLNFDQVERTEETFDPNTVARQKTRSTESNKGRSTSPAPGGAAAGGENADKEPAQSVTQNDGTRESESMTFEVSRVVAKTLTTPGDIRRVTVAVMLNVPTRGPGDARAPAPRPAEDVEKIRRVVMGAVGFNEKRGDEVTVVEVAFDTSAADRERALLDSAPPAAAPVASPGAFAIDRTWILAGAGAVAFIVVAWLVLRVLARGRARVELADSLAAGEAPAPAPARAAVPRAAMAPRAPTQLVSDDVLALSQEREDIRQKALAMASTEPEATAQLLRAWLVKKKAAHGRGVGDA